MRNKKRKGIAKEGDKRNKEAGAKKKKKTRRHKEIENIQR